MFRMTVNGDLCDFLRYSCGFLPHESQENGRQYTCYQQHIVWSCIVRRNYTTYMYWTQFSFTHSLSRLECVNENCVQYMYVVSDVNNTCYLHSISLKKAKVCVHSGKQGKVCCHMHYPNQCWTFTFLKPFSYSHLWALLVFRRVHSVYSVSSNWTCSVGYVCYWLVALLH